MIRQLIATSLSISFAVAVAGTAGASSISFGHAVSPRGFNSAFNGGSGWQGPAVQKRCKVNGTPAYLFTNDFVAGNVYEYCEDMPPNLTTPLRTSLGTGGGGLAVSPVALGAGGEKLAVGGRGDIKIYNVALATGAPTLVSTLTLTNSSAVALGLCFDGTGGLYATNFGTSTIDYFKNASVLGAGPFPPTHTWNAQTGPGAIFQGYYLACDFDTLGIKKPPVENYVMVDGIDASGNVDVGQFGGPSNSSTVTVSAVLGGSTSNFPGGMAINKTDNLIVNDPLANELIDFGRIEPWNRGFTAVCLEQFPQTEYLPITFDDTQRELWAGNIFNPGSNPTTDAVSLAYPFSSKKPCVSPGESGGPTTPIQNEEFVGIAVYPNTGV